MLYNSILEKIVLPLGDFLNGSTVIKNLNAWRKICTYSEDELRKISKANLFSILEYASQNIPYYYSLREFKTENPYIWIKDFPIMTKTLIKKDVGSLTIKPTQDLIKLASSGSSGIHSEVYLNKNDQSINRAIQALWMEWSGWKMGVPLLQTGMTYPRGKVKAAKDFLLRTKYYLAFGLSDDDILTLLNQKYCDGSYLGGYASSLYLIAKVALKEKLNLKLKAAISWGDKMFPHYREMIENAFHCSVFDTYGCSEGLMIAAQKDLEYYYIMSPHVYVELLDSEGNEVEDGELGYVVATRLDGYAMPLIRYYLGDLAIKLPKSKYPVKREMNFPLLEKIIGRDTDIVYTRSGKYMIVHFFTGIFEYIPEIEQFRVVQENLDGITIEYVKGRGFNNGVLHLVESKIKKYLNEPFRIKWLEINVIPDSPSGKPQIIKSHLPQLL